MQIKIKTLLEMLKNISNGVKAHKKQELSFYVLIKIIEKKIFCIAINNQIEMVTCDNFEKKEINTEILIKYNLIYNICRTNNENSNINIDQSTNSTIIKVENSKFILTNLNNQIFPTFPIIKKFLVKFKIKTQILINFLKHALITTTEDSPKLFLNGILFDINKNNLSILSADGFRLTYSMFLIENNETTKVIIPKNTINEISNTFCNEKETIILISHNQVKFITNNITITSKIINDIYEYPQLNLSKKNKSIEIDTQEMKNALKKISILISIKNSITLIIEKTNIIIKTKNNNENATIILKKKNKHKLTININYKYFLDILKLITTEIFNIIITENEKIIIKENNKDSFYVIMSFYT